MRFASFNSIIRPLTYAYVSVAFILLAVVPQSTGSIGSINFHFVDKIEHLIISFGLGFLLYLFFIDSKKRIVSKNAFLITIFAGIFFGVGNEFVQVFVPGKVFNPVDAFYDSVGTILGALSLQIRKFF